MHRRSMLLAAAGAVTLARPSFAQTANITGAGATFPRPIYERWGQAAREGAGVTLNYQSIGSGGGINQISNRTVDFGATDAPLSAEQLDERKLLQFPTVMGSVVLVVNIPGVADNALKLPPDVITDLFLGKIRRWNDARIAAANPELRLPNLPVSPTYRADASGTTFVFTTYLARVSDDWKNGPGAGTSVRWPVGNGQRGNEGVSNLVRNTPGAIGYTENAYATVNRLVTTQIRNKSGNYVTPTMESFRAAAAMADWNSPGFAANLVDLEGAAVWPIVSPTFVLLPTNPEGDRVAGSLSSMKFFDWAYRNGDAAALQLEYLPLPDAVKAQVRAAWRASIKNPAGEAIWPA